MTDQPGPVPTIERLIGVYNAEHTLRGELRERGRHLVVDVAQLQAGRGHPQIEEGPDRARHDASVADAADPVPPNFSRR